LYLIGIVYITIIDIVYTTILYKCLELR